MHRPTVNVHVMLEFLDLVKAAGQFYKLLSTCTILALLNDLDSHWLVSSTQQHLLFFITLIRGTLRSRAT